MTNLERAYRVAAEMAIDEAVRASGLFPDNRHQYVALAEEAGELAQALLDLTYGKTGPAHVTEEAVQVAAMALRIIAEGDPEFGYTGAFTE